MTIASTGASRAWDAPGWRRAGLAVAAGLVATFGLPPYDVPVAGFIAFPLLVMLLDGLAGRGEGGRAAFRLGWCFGFGYFVGGLWWLGAAMLVDAEAFLWALPLAVLGLPAVLAVYFGLALAASRFFWSADAGRILVLAVALTIAEYLRARLLSGFPWNEIGLLAAPSPLFMQSVDWLGPHGLTLVATTLFCAPVLLLRRQAGRGPVLALALGLIVLHAGYGAYRLAGAPVAAASAPRVRIVQPNIDQSQKWDPAEANLILERLLTMTRQDGGGGDGPQMIVWPESSFPYLITEGSPVVQAVAARLAPQETLLAGAARIVERPGEAEPAYYNSILAIGPSGAVEGQFDKVHLVPFGEYLPAQSLLESLGIMQLTQMPGGFAAADRRSEGRLPGLPAFLPLICYEVIFAHEVARSPDTGFILNVTNDAWYGRTPGPYQHLRQAQLTAVALGLPLVRAANSGISVIADSAGRPVARLGLGEQGVLSAPLPAARPATVYAVFGNLAAALGVAIWGLAAWLLRRSDILPHRAQAGE